uniref:Uncharacterized protein n=1 Tax=Arundo donax TaxID=35708 RepID=A0A0A9F3R6_ARUDO
MEYKVYLKKMKRF